METSYLLLIITCVLYGASGLVQDWDDIGQKVVNSLVAIFVIVIVILTGDDGFFDEEWINYIFPIPAIFLGSIIYGAIEDIEGGDWTVVCILLSVIGIIATIVTTACGI